MIFTNLLLELLKKQSSAQFGEVLFRPENSYPDLRGQISPGEAISQRAIQLIRFLEQTADDRVDEKPQTYDAIRPARTLALPRSNCPALKGIAQDQDIMADGYVRAAFLIVQAKGRKQT